jgi:hypothetical protein
VSGDLDRVPLRVNVDDDHLLGGAWRFVEEFQAHVAAGLGHSSVGPASTAPTSRMIASAGRSRAEQPAVVAPRRLATP